MAEDRNGATGFCSDDSRFTILAENIREIFWILDPKNWRAVYLNPAFERVTGIGLDEVYADPKVWRKALHPDDRTRVDQELDRRNAAGEPHNLEFRIVRSDGEIRWIWARGLPVRDDDGNPVIIGVAEDITERKRTEHELEWSLSLLRATLQATADGILAIDERGRITAFNSRFVELWRIPDHVAIEAGQEEALWNHARNQLVNPTWFERRRSEIEGQPDIDSFELLEFSDGRTVEAYSRPRRIGERFAGRVWSFRDTTARTRAERELRERSRRLRLHNDVLFRLARQRAEETVRRPNFEVITEAAAEMLETERVGVWLWEANRNSICIVEVFENARGGRHQFGERVSRDEAPSYFAALEQQRALAIDDVRTDPRTAELHDYFDRHDIASMLDAPIRAGGEFVGVVCFERIGRPRRWSIEDIGFAGSIADLAAIALENANRHRAEWGINFLAEASALLSSSLDFQTTIGNVVELTIPTLADWCAVDVLENGDVTRLMSRHGYPDKEPLLRELDRRYRSDWKSAQLSSPAVRSGKPELVPEITEDIWESRTHGPEHRRLLEELGLRSYMAVPLKARDRILGVITFASNSLSFDQDDLSLALDLAGRAALAMDNAMLYESAQQSNRAKSDFLAVMSHELRTPLTAIIGYADLALSEVTGKPVSPIQKEHLERIMLRSQDLARIIDEILAFAETETGAEPPRPAPIDLRDLLRDATDQARPMVEEAGLEFRVRLPDSPTRVNTNPTSVHHILRNLISNAVRFTGSGRVEVEGGIENGRVRVRVSDTGIGIEPKYQERIFEPFFQVEAATTREKGGTGLGLSVARRYARLLGGDVLVDSDPGKGSTFTLELPTDGAPRTKPD